MDTPTSQQLYIPIPLRWQSSHLFPGKGPPSSCPQDSKQFFCKQGNSYNTCATNGHEIHRLFAKWGQNHPQTWVCVWLPDQGVEWCFVHHHFLHVEWLPFHPLGCLTALVLGVRWSLCQCRRQAVAMVMHFSMRSKSAFTQNSAMNFWS